MTVLETVQVRSILPAHKNPEIALCACPGLLEPGVVGLFHPILLLSADITERLRPSQLKPCSRMSRPMLGGTIT